MQIDECIYFSPNVRINEIDLINKRKEVLYAFKGRIEEYYFKPISILNENKHAFAAGTILLTLIDIFARFSFKSEKNAERYKYWLQFCSGIDPKYTETIYSNYRNGLIHEGHLKNNVCFSYDFNDMLIQENEINNIKYSVINPKELEKKLKKYFDKYMQILIEVQEEIENENEDFLDIDDVFLDKTNHLLLPKINKKYTREENIIKLNNIKHIKHNNNNNNEYGYFKYIYLLFFQRLKNDFSEEITNFSEFKFKAIVSDEVAITSID